MPIGVSIGTALGVSGTILGASAAGIAGGALLGAGGGALLSGITGGDPLMGALTGGLSGGALGFGPALGGALGIGSVGGGALAGGAAGALGSGITGGDPLMGALQGGAAGAISGALSGPSEAAPGATGSPGSSGPGAGASAGASGAPSGIGFSPDATFVPNSGATEGINFGNFSGNLGGGTAGGAGFAGPNTASVLSTIGQSPAAPAPPPASGIGGFLDRLSDTNMLIPAGGLLMSAVKGTQEPAGLDKIKGAASQLAGQGADLQGYIQNGNLPPGVQQSLNQAAQSAKATIRSNYASRGMAGSSAEVQDLAAVDRNVASQGASIAMQLLNTGISETNMASGLYKQIMDTTMKQDDELGQALTNFGLAFSGNSPPQQGITINYGGKA